MQVPWLQRGASGSGETWHLICGVWERRAGGCSKRCTAGLQNHGHLCHEDHLRQEVKQHPGWTDESKVAPILPGSLVFCKSFLVLVLQVKPSFCIIKLWIAVVSLHETLQNSREVDFTFFRSQREEPPATPYLHQPIQEDMLMCLHGDRYLRCSE